MDRNKRKNLLIYSLTALVLVASLFSITQVYILSRNKIKEQMFKTSEKEIEIIVGQIKNTFHYEIEDFVYMLELIKENINLDFNSLEKTEELLGKVREKGAFSALGIIDSKGNGFNTNGNQIKIDIEKITKNFIKIKGNEKYYFVSNVLSEKEKDKKEISIGIPIYKNNKLEGFLFGRQPIEKISERIDSYLRNGLYFHIIDDIGNYLTCPFNLSSLSDGELTLWEKLEKYKSYFEKGYSYEKIRSDIEKGQSGFFILNDYKGGRYVIYEPLGVNNWYIIPVITKEKLNLRTNEYLKISDETLYYMVGLILFTIIILLSITYYNYRFIKNQSDKNKLFKILTNKTRDIFFEIHLYEKIFILYNFSEEDNKMISFPLDIISPKNMLKNNRIRKKDFLIYKELYKNISEGKNIEKFTIELNIKNIWRWYRINSIFFNSDNIIGIMEDFTKEQSQGMEIGRINEKSKYDFLTGLYNRETFEKEFENFVNKNIDSNKKSFLIILDLDNFKKVNDSLGHIIGDRVLREASNTLKSNLKSSDIIGRLGGDEFIILIKNLDSLEQIHKIANSLNRALIKNYKKNTNNITVSSSIGITEVNIESSFKETYEKADKALYKVKNSGRNSYFIEK